MKNNLARFEPKNIIIGLAYGDPAIMAAARENPGTALAVIGNSYGDEKINLPVLARATDEALGMIANPVEARKVLNQNLLPAAQAELTAVHGDRLSVILQIADPQVVITALGEDSYNSREAVDICFMLMAWADNIKTRPDWDQLLEMEVAGRSLRDLLIAGLYHQADGDTGEITLDMWEKVGLEFDQDAYRMRDLIEEETMPRFSKGDIARARTRLRAQRRKFEDATAGVSHADADKDDIDI